MNDSDHDRSDKEGEEVFCVKLYQVFKKNKNKKYE